MTGGSQLARIATVGADGTPHVVPVAWIYNAARDTIEVGGYELELTKKFRDVARPLSRRTVPSKSNPGCPPERLILWSRQAESRPISVTSDARH